MLQPQIYDLYYKDAAVLVLCQIMVCITAVQAHGKKIFLKVSLHVRGVYGGGGRYTGAKHPRTGLIEYTT